MTEMKHQEHKPRGPGCHHTGAQQVGEERQRVVQFHLFVVERTAKEKSCQKITSPSDGQGCQHKQAQTDVVVSALSSGQGSRVTSNIT